MPLPLPAPPRAAAAGLVKSSSIGRNAGPERVLVGARAHADLPALAAVLRRLGARVDAFETIGVLAARAPSGAALVAGLRRDPRVAYIERDRTLRVAADPFDTMDPEHRHQVHVGLRRGPRGRGACRRRGRFDARRSPWWTPGSTSPTRSSRGPASRRTFDTLTREQDVTDVVGHGTFVSGLIAAIDGNGVGGKGVAGNTKLVVVRASRDGAFTVGDLIARHRVLDQGRRGCHQPEPRRPGLYASQARALAAAFFNDVLPVAASGNNGLAGNPLEFPAAAVGGPRGQERHRPVRRPRPGRVARSRRSPTTTTFVSIAAPGAGAGGCAFGIFSTLPAGGGTAWDDPRSCSLVFLSPESRYAYAEGTSFAAPVVSGIAAVVWQVERRLASEQVAEVLTRSARQTIGSGWNEFTGAGILDAAAATALARTYDVTAPIVRGRARRAGRR